ncbi:MAG: hypothetical protein F4X82_03020 [Candidatus Spechtbacteria bacterium SB0662_bin_43]|uniref:Uncharacterized protein n=1 Tax=Candidatus Spechtbacteria bacterium SB0662_bin_43 TaxID=2604897 RepID=A0A845DM98_9BACT|nr:hypothetical protein [Candidatus Spechtbacteria bacterium SB0662_bin_43]
MHYCRTRCDYWGVPWNARHGHNNPSTTIYTNDVPTKDTPNRKDETIKASPPINNVPTTNTNVLPAQPTIQRTIDNQKEIENDNQNLRTQNTRDITQQSNRETTNNLNREDRSKSNTSPILLFLVVGLLSILGALSLYNLRNKKTK